MVAGAWLVAWSSTLTADEALADDVSTANSVLRISPSGSRAIIGYHPGTVSVLAELDWESGAFTALMAVPRRGQFLVDWEDPQTLAVAFTVEGTCDGFVARIDLPARRRAHAGALATSRGIRRQRVDLSAVAQVNAELPVILSHWGDLDRRRWAGIAFFDHPDTCVTRWAGGELLSQEELASPTVANWTGPEPTGQLLGLTPDHRWLAESTTDGRRRLLMLTGTAMKEVVSVAGGGAVEVQRWPGTDTVYRAWFANGPDYFVDQRASAASHRFPLTGKKRATVLDAAGTAVLVRSDDAFYVALDESAAPVRVESARPWTTRAAADPDTSVHAPDGTLSNPEREALKRLGVAVTGTAHCTWQRRPYTEERWETQIQCGIEARKWLHQLARETDAERAERLGSIAQFLRNNSGKPRLAGPVR